MFKVRAEIWRSENCCIVSGRPEAKGNFFSESIFFYFFHCPNNVAKTIREKIF